MLTDIHKTRDELKALSSGSEGKIHIGVFPASTSVLLPQALMLLKQRSPGTNVLVTEGTAISLLPELWQGKLDMVVGRLPSRNAMNGFEEKALLEEPVLLMTGRHHPLAKKKKLQWSDLKSYPWVLPPMDSFLRDPLERALFEHGVPLSNNYIETLSTHLARAYLHITDAIAVMAGAAAHDATDRLAVLPLTLPKLVRPAGVLWSKNRSLSPGAKLMISCLDEAATILKKKSD
jgi:DNA-binding transcriptional LysR family regulator